MDAGRLKLFFSFWVLKSWRCLERPVAQKIQDASHVSSPVSYWSVPIPGTIGLGGGPDFCDVGHLHANDEELSQTASQNSLPLPT